MNIEVKDVQTATAKARDVLSDEQKSQLAAVEQSVAELDERKQETERTLAWLSDISYQDPGLTLVSSRMEIEKRLCSPVYESSSPWETGQRTGRKYQPKQRHERSTLAAPSSSSWMNTSDQRRVKGWERRLRTVLPGRLVRPADAKRLQN